MKPRTTAFTAIAALAVNFGASAPRAEENPPPLVRLDDCIRAAVKATRNKGAHVSEAANMEDPARTTKSFVSAVSGGASSLTVAYTIVSSGEIEGRLYITARDKPGTASETKTVFSVDGKNITGAKPYIADTVPKNADAKILAAGQEQVRKTYDAMVACVK